MPKLTYEALVNAGACKQREEFHRIAGEGIELTDELAAQYAEHFDIEFSVMHLLTHENMKNMMREIAIAVSEKRFTSRECREYKVFYAVTAAKWYRKQLQDGCKS